MMSLWEVRTPIVSNECSVFGKGVLQMNSFSMLTMSTRNSNHLILTSTKCPAVQKFLQTCFFPVVFPARSATNVLWWFCSQKGGSPTWAVDVWSTYAFFYSPSCGQGTRSLLQRYRANRMISRDIEDVKGSKTAVQVGVKNEIKTTIKQKAPTPKKR